MMEDRQLIMRFWCEVKSEQMMSKILDEVMNKIHNVFFFYFTFFFFTMVQALV